MRTREIFRYLVAMIIALSTTVNAMAQERNLKIYFNEHSDTATGPRIYVTDDNSKYGIPLGTKVSAEGLTWATGARWFSIFQQSVTDRVLADYEDESGMASHLKISFMDEDEESTFPYEVNNIQWNIMNDLFSGTILGDAFDNLQINTVCTPAVGNSSSYTEEHWELNPFARNASFTRSDFPSSSGLVLNGLKSFELSEKNFFKIKVPIIGWTIYSRQTELNDRCREFIKARWNGSYTNPKVKDDDDNLINIEEDDNCWAFKVTFTLPDIRMRSYSWRFANNVGTLGELDNNIIKGESGKHALRGYITAHAGNVVPIEAPADPDDNIPEAFHYEYFAKDPNQITIIRTTGVITNAKVAGDIPVIVKLMRGNREVCSYEQKIHVYSNDPTRSEIAIGFLNGNKGYDVTVGDQNAQIQGIITKYGENITLSNGTSGYHFEYSEDSNGEIIDIDPLTGKITAKKEGNVYVSAVLKNGNTVASNIYTYKLHVFAQHEGMDWKLEKTYTYTNSSNKNDWSTNTTNSSSNEWESKDLLMVNTTINGSSDWKQIACFTTPASQNWRGICQTIQFDLRIPKYTKITGTYPLAGNLNIGSSKGSSIKYGFESKDLGAVDAATADTNVKDITWKTQGYHNGTNASTNKYPTQIIADATSYNNGNIGNEKDYRRSLDNLTSEHVTRTRYLAIMAYLHRDNSYPGDASFGFKNIPTYEYYSTVTYYNNDGTSNVWRTQNFTSTSKTDVMPMYNGSQNLPTRAGYEFLGWSTDPNATTAEYPGKGGDFCPYDDVNGGGKGPVDLYAVWRANVYTVELRHTSTGPVDGYVYAVYDQNMPLVDVDGNAVKAPTNKGYDFNGYFAEKNGTGTKYYNVDMSSNHVWDRAEENYVIARWIPHKTTVVFDPQGGIRYYGATEVTATYDQAMPTVGLYQGQSQNVSAPQRQGYTFGGYYSKTNGQGTQYYTADMTSARTWNIDERLLNPPTTEVTLYAKWIPNTYTVTLDPQGGTGGSSSTTATYGQPLSSGLTAPTKDGYEFKGYYSNENQEYAESTGQDYGGKQYYDKNMNGVESWDKTDGGTIFAHWAPKTYIVTFDLGDESHAAIFPDNVVNANKDRIMEITSDGKMKVSFDYGISGDNSIDLSVPKKPGYEMLGWYDANGDLIVTVDIKDRHAYITDKNNYWQKDGNNVKWNYADDLVLTAKFRCKYTVEDAGNGPIIKFDNEIVEPDQDWLSSVISDLQGAAKEVGTPENPVMAFDLRTSKNIWTGNKFARLNVMESLQSEEYKDYISPNVLVYFNDNESEAWYIDGTKPEYQGRNDADCYNAVSLDNKCRNLVVTDRFPIKIPYAFNASKASYARDAKVNDAATEQASKSTWGTLCLPYPIKNNTNGVKFYWLQSTANNYMEFEEFGDNAIIPANTPVLYSRTDGDVSSKINIVEANVNVLENADYTPVIIDYANPKKGTYPLESASATLQDWEFRGNLKTNIFYGAKYVGEIEENAQRVDNGDVYYFKQNKFTHLTPAMTKMVNGKEVHYNAGKMTIYPYRAYFFKKGIGGSAKFSAYSILVVDEFGNTTDITNAVFGDGEGDGKIYDLNGIRVMQPVKGRLYIVNGQKKVYR